MRQIFVSYSRDIEPTARAIVADMQALGYGVWFDQALSGGQAWWDQILQRIRETDALVFLAAPASLNSAACASEIRYALQLGKSVVPVLVAEGVSMGLLPPELARLHVVDRRIDDKEAAMRLSRALSLIATSPPLPDPLPEPPPAPTSYLSGLASRVDGPEPLSFEAQSSLVVELRHGLRDASQREDSRAVLAKLRRRRDVYAAVAAEIDEALNAVAGVAASTASPDAERVVHVGRRIDDRVETSSPVLERLPSIGITAKSPLSVRGRLAAAGLCAVVVLVLSFAPAVMMGTVDSVMPSLVAAVGAAVAGALAGRDRMALLWVVIGAILGFVVFNFLGLLAIAFGMPSGALIGAAIVSIRRRRAQRAAGIEPRVVAK